MYKIFLIILLSLLPSIGFAQSIIDDYKSACPGRWSSQTCLNIVSTSTEQMIKHYAKQLNKQGHATTINTLTEECAAATAANQGTYPADAMRSAFTACANYLAEQSSAIHIQPNPTLYQMLIGSVLCLSEDQRCSSIESQLKGS